MWRDASRDPKVGSSVTGTSYGVDSSEEVGVKVRRTAARRWG